MDLKNIFLFAPVLNINKQFKIGYFHVDTFQADFPFFLDPLNKRRAEMMVATTM